MKYGICLISIIPVRISEKEQSEMTNQLLFGETFEIIKETDRWCFIKSYFDNESGWIDKKVCFYISIEIFNQIHTNTKLTISNQITIQNDNISFPQTILPGSDIPNISKNKSNFSIDSSKFSFLSKPQTINNNNALSQSVIKVAASFINAPYLWGGRSLYGIDCSGFTQIIFKICGIAIPRNSYQQSNFGNKINNIEDTKTGDLVFFDNKNGNISHVGIIMNKEKIIHSSGKVRIDKIDKKGIFNEEKQLYTHHLKIIRRITN